MDGDNEGHIEMVVTMVAMMGWMVIMVAILG